MALTANIQGWIFRKSRLTWGSEESYYGGWVITRASHGARNYGWEQPWVDVLWQTDECSVKGESRLPAYCSCLCLGGGGVALMSFPGRRYSRRSFGGSVEGDGAPSGWNVCHTLEERLAGKQTVLRLILMNSRKIKMLKFSSESLTRDTLYLSVIICIVLLVWMKGDWKLNRDYDPGTTEVTLLYVLCQSAVCICEQSGRK